MTGAQAIPAPGAPGLPAGDPAPLPYGYAKRHGVILGPATDEAVTVWCREDASGPALLEVQRVLGRAVRFEPLPRPRFEALLTEAYDRGGNRAD